MRESAQSGFLIPYFLGTKLSECDSQTWQLEIHTKAGVEIFSHVCRGRLQKRSHVLNSLDSLRPTLTLCSENNSSGQQHLSGFADFWGKRQTFADRLFLPSASPQLLLRTWENVHQSQNWQCPGHGPSRPALGSGRGASAGVMSLWLVNLSLEFSLTIIWSSNHTSRKREISDEKRNNRSCQGRREQEGEREKPLFSEVVRHAEVMTLATC